MSDLPYPYFALYKDAAGQWRWRIKARNHKVLGDSSEGYIRREDALHGIELVKGATNVWDETTRTWL